MTRESGGGGGSGNQPQDYEGRMLSVGDNRAPGLDGAPVHSGASAQAWNREYARMYGQYDPLRAGGAGNESMVYGDNPPDPLYNNQGRASGTYPTEAERLFGYQQLGDELERRHRELVQAAQDVFLQRQQARQMAQIALVIGDVWKKVYPDRQLPQALAQGVGGGGGGGGRLNMMDPGGPDGIDQLPQSLIPPHFPGTDEGEWHDRYTRNLDDWSADKVAAKDDQVFAADSQHAENDYARIERQRAIDRASEPAQQQAAQQQRNTRMGA